MFARVNLLKNEITSYLDKMQLVPVILDMAIRDYLSGRWDDFQRQTREIQNAESELDAIRKDIELKMYKYTLLPESRRDILTLLERLDDVANYSERLLKSFRAETPSIPEYLHERFYKMCEINIASIKELTDTLERYFNNRNSLTGAVGKVRYYEHEVDVLYEDLIAEIFQGMELPLDRKIHIRYFAEKLSRITDIAEDVSEYLIIASLKREI